MNRMDEIRSATSGMRVAFITSRFPYLTETFIVRDMWGLIHNGVPIDIFSLLRPKHSVVTESSQQLLDLTWYGHPMSLRALRSQLWFLYHRPVRYLRALVGVVKQSWREPAVTAKALWLFPVSVQIAREAEHRSVDHVHANFVWLEALTAGIVKDLTDIPFSIRPHAFGLFSRNRENVRAQLEKASGIVTVSNYHRDFVADVLQRPKDEIAVVHYGIDTSFYTPAPDERRPA